MLLYFAPLRKDGVLVTLEQNMSERSCESRFPLLILEPRTTLCSLTLGDAVHSKPILIEQIGEEGWEL